LPRPHIGLSGDFLWDRAAATAASRRRYALSLSRAFALRGKIGGQGGIGDYILKPKGMHWRTFERAMERVNGAEEIVEAHTALLLARLQRSL